MQYCRINILQSLFQKAVLRSVSSLAIQGSDVPCTAISSIAQKILMWTELAILCFCNGSSIEQPLSSVTISGLFHCVVYCIYCVFLCRFQQACDTFLKLKLTIFAYQDMFPIPVSCIPLCEQFSFAVTFTSRIYVHQFNNCEPSLTQAQMPN